jgi:hypothetical protein
VRRRLREQELRDDADDERREKSEAEQAKRDAERAAQPKPIPAVGKISAAATSSRVSRVEQPSGPQGPAAIGPVGPSLPSSMGPAGPAVGPLGPASPPAGASSSSISIKTVANKKPDAKASKPKNAAFAVEEEAPKNKRKLVKLEYGADDAAAGGVAVDAARSAAAAAAKLINNKRGRGNGESAAERAKRLIGSVPKEKEELYVYKVDWALLESAKTFQLKLEPWIAKKVTEYFGERDETVISFVMEEVILCTCRSPH